MTDRYEPVPVPRGDGRHDIGEEMRAAIVNRLIADWSLDPDLSPEKVRQLAMWAGASVRALFHELGTLRDLSSQALGAVSTEVCAVDPVDGIGQEGATRDRSSSSFSVSCPVEQERQEEELERLKEENAYLRKAAADVVRAINGEEVDFDGQTDPWATAIGDLRDERVWQVMATAPIGEDVILYSSESNPSMVVGHCFDDADGDWYPQHTTTLHGSPFDVAFTHWKPLPSPPEQAASPSLVSAPPRVEEQTGE